MSESINLAVSNPKEKGEEVPEISLYLSLSGEKTYRIKEMLKYADEDIHKELAENIVRIIAGEKDIISDNPSLNDYEEAATFVLSEFGIPAHTKGYRYLRAALISVAQNPILVDGITKCLYPDIAEHYDTTAARVERVIRHAIESGCTRGDTQALYYYFPHSLYKDKVKPTNAEFIAVMADVVKKRVSKRQITFADI